MKQVSRIVGVFLIFLMVLSMNALAADAKIDTATASDGYFSVFCEGDAGVKMKVGVTFAGKTEYYTYIPGKTASYAFEKGNGEYTIALYRNVSGTSYKRVAKAVVSVRLKNAAVPYLVSTTEITFAEGDAITGKAAELCKGLSSNTAKVIAIHNYIAEHFRYDDAFAASVRKGAVKNYTPDTNRALEKNVGVCYDFSAVFAAMCRSQGIPCTVEKGYISSGYHAWNRVYPDGKWITVDMTRSVVQRNYHADRLAECTAVVK